MPEEIQHYDVNVTAVAKTDLKDIIAYISRNNPRTALKILEKIENRISTLDHFPYRGGYVPELLKKNITEYR
jgi:plasmid stabilization system protein ParE